MSKNLKISFCIFILFPFLSFGQITVDGYFNDWNNIQTQFNDTKNDNQNNYPDLISLKTYSDSNYIYLNLILDKEFSIQNNSNIKIYIDNDCNVNTGFKIHDIGADIVWDFKTNRACFYHNGIMDSLNHHYIGIIPLPSYNSNQFEIAINRNSIYSSQKLFPNNEIKLIISSNDYDFIPDTGSISLQLSNKAPLIDTNLKAKDINADFRIMSYNCLKDKIFNITYYNNFKRILSAINADIMCFEEIYDHTATQTDSLVSTMINNSSVLSYYSYKFDPDIVVLSKFPIIDTSRINGNSAYTIDLSSINKPNILLIVCHLAAGNEDSYRQYEVNHILAFISKIKADPNSMKLRNEFPYIILGDFNSVGDSQQIKSLLKGEITDSKVGESFSPDWDNSDLVDLCPHNANSNTAFTWYSAYSDFAAGRMDYMLYTDSKIQPLNSFVLFTDFLNEDVLKQFNLYESDSKKASDHLPIVCDFQVKTNNYVEIDPNSKSIDNIFDVFNNNNVSNVKIYDYLGNNIKLYNIDIKKLYDSLNHGVYILMYDYEHQTKYFKFIR